MKYEIDFRKLPDDVRELVRVRAIQRNGQELDESEDAMVIEITGERAKRIAHAIESGLGADVYAVISYAARKGLIS